MCLQEKGKGSNKAHVSLAEQRWSPTSWRSSHFYSVSLPASVKHTELCYFSAHVIRGHLTCRAHPLLLSPCVSWLRGQALQLSYLPVCGPPDPGLVCDAGCLLWATCELGGCSWPWDALCAITQCCNCISLHPHRWQNETKHRTVKNNGINPQSYAAMRFVCEIPAVWKGLDGY